MAKILPFHKPPEAPSHDRRQTFTLPVDAEKPAKAVAKRILKDEDTDGSEP